MKKMLLFFIFLTNFIGIAFATPLTCPPYRDIESNKLFNMEVIGTQKSHFDDNEGDDIMPDLEIKHGNVWIQYFYPAKHREYKKLFLACAYQDRTSLAKEITSKYQMCIRKFGDTPKLLYFSCP